MPRRAALGISAAAGMAARARTASTQPGAAQAAGRVVLLGDSVFDNAGYLRGSGPDVVAQLGARLTPGWRATLLARGGSVAADVPGQLGQLPPDATHLVISAGGNDAGRREGVLGEPARSVADGLAAIAALRDGFARDYRAMLDAALRRGLPVAVCTIYDPRFPEPGRRRVAVVALHPLANLPRILVDRRLHKGQTVRQRQQEISERRMALAAGMLRRIGVPFEEDDLKRHVLLGHPRIHPALVPADFLDWADAWMKKLRAENRRTRLFDPGSLRFATGYFWALACKASSRRLGWPRTARKLLASSLTADLVMAKHSRAWVWGAMRAIASS